MINTIVLFFEIFIIFSTLVLMTKLLGKYGAIAYVSIITLITDFIADKSIKISVINVPMFIILFVSIVVTTNLITECYGVNIARKAIYIGVCTNVFFMIFMAILSCNNSVEIPISFNIKTILSLTIAYFIPLIANTFIFEKLIGKDRNKGMWLRNIISTTICSWVISIICILISYIGDHSILEIVITILTIQVVELIVVAISTPVLYLIKYLSKRRFFRKRF